MTETAGTWTSLGKSRQFQQCRLNFRASAGRLPCAVMILGFPGWRDRPPGTRQLGRVTEILDCVVDTTDPSGFGHIRSAVLKLRGPLRDMQVFRDHDALPVGRRRRHPRQPMYLQIGGREIPSSPISWHVRFDEKDLTSLTHHDAAAEFHKLYVMPLVNVEKCTSRGRTLFELCCLILGHSESAHKEEYKRVDLLKLATGERENSFFGVLFDGVLRSFDVV